MAIQNVLLPREMYLASVGVKIVRRRRATVAEGSKIVIRE
jgi:hypothetical protein